MGGAVSSTFRMIYGIVVALIGVLAIVGGAGIASLLVLAYAGYILLGGRWIIY